MSKQAPQITDLPIWSDCPFWDLVPEEIEIRLGESEGKQVLAFWWPKYQLNTCLDFETLDLNTIEQTLEVVVSAMAGAQFDKEYPGIFEAVLRARATETMGQKIPDSLQAPMARLLELDRLISRAAIAPSSPQAAS